MVPQVLSVELGTQNQAPTKDAFWGCGFWVSFCLWVVVFFFFLAGGSRLQQLILGKNF